MNKKFKFAYYFFVTIFALVFSYQIYRLVNLINEMPGHNVGVVTSETAD